jgi:hypothetical protein
MFVLLAYEKDADGFVLAMVIGPFDDEADAWTFHEGNVSCDHADVVRLVSVQEINEAK